MSQLFLSPLFVCSGIGASCGLMASLPKNCIHLPRREIEDHDRRKKHNADVWIEEGA